MPTERRRTVLSSLMPTWQRPLSPSLEGMVRCAVDDLLETLDKQTPVPASDPAMEEKP